MNHLKADILQVGFVDKDGTPQNWFFDCNAGVAAITICEDGSLLWGGYTVDELRQISLLH
jgi:hypothetical protein